jgi:N-methylhydantoinase A
MDNGGGSILPYRIAVDIGGTFTDLVSVDETTGALSLAKDSTTPADFARGVLSTLRRSNVDLSHVHHFVHGSTVIINALTERKGSPTALLTTRGFRDVLEIGRANRPDMYSYHYVKPRPFVPRRHRFEVDERVDYKGHVVRALDEDDVRGATRQCKHEGISSIAVCYLHSYVNPEHERRTEAIIKEEYPEAFVTLSHTMTREWREYERTSTAVLNAYVQPIASGYLNSLEGALVEKGLRIVKHAMQSNGGVTTFENAKRSPIQLVESGPVGGVIGATILGKAAGYLKIISLDVGGTTAKTSLVEGGEVKINTDYRIEATPYSAGYPIKIPVVDVVEIGAGGGSIAWIDRGGVLRVGPVSAGADPGPACYAKGGAEPTLTDANVLTGRINPEYFLGGEIKLDVEKARQAVEGQARRLGMAVRETALGIIRIANSSMANALRMVSVRRGYDPRDFVMIAMGGAGGLHAAYLAAQLGIKKVLIPKAPAHFSAWGMLMTDLRHDYVTTRVLELSPPNLEELDSIFAQTEGEAFNQLSTEGVEAEGVKFSRFVDMRYEGQEHTVEVPVPPGRLRGEDLAVIKDRFDELHQLRYTFRLQDRTEVVNTHLVALGVVRKPELKPQDSGVDDLKAAIKGTRDVDFDDFGVHTTVVYERDRLPPYTLTKGPAIVEEPASTTVVYPDHEFEIDRYGDLVIHTGGGG